MRPISEKRPTVSFEFFPPKTEDMEQTLWTSIEKLECLDPDFVSVTYGAGGSTRERTHRTVKRLVQDTAMKPAAHLTCVCATRAEIDEVIRDYWSAGVRHIVALRGDPPEGIGAAYEPHPGGYVNAADLTSGIRAIGDFEVSVGCYPEKHPESASFDADIDLLKQKIDNGATRAITQFFFDADVYERYLERVRAAGITIPIVPGIMPITSYKGISRMASGIGASVPREIADLFETLDDDPATRKLVAATVAVSLCTRLLEIGAEALHFYTLNRAELTYAICHMLGIRPNQDQVAA